MKEIAKYSNCFVCGDKNKTGLQARFFYDGKSAITEIIADTKMEGYQGIYHGGIISALLDEVMIKAILAIDKYVVTAEMTVKYIAPIRTGEKIKFIGTISKSRGRLYFTEGKAVNSQDRIVASATGTYLEAKENLKSELLNSLD